MKFFLDTASLKDISWAAQAGLIDGVTTNPSLLAKQAGDLDPRDVLKEICSLVDGPVSAEVVDLETDGMVREGSELAKIADNIVVKIPMTEAGMVAVRRLATAGIKHDVKEYSGAGHGFINDHDGAGDKWPLLFAVFARLSPGLGYHEASAQDARRRIIAFFDAHLKA